MWRLRPLELAGHNTESKNLEGRREGGKKGGKEREREGVVAIYRGMASNIWQNTGLRMCGVKVHEIGISTPIKQ